MTQRLPRPALTPLPEETAQRQAEDAALIPHMRAFLRDNLPLLHRPWSA